jgi:hypothetical protein
VSKVYLGDAVYAEHDEVGATVLTTSDGLRDTNRIVLEREVVNAFLRFALKPGAYAALEAYDREQDDLRKHARQK